MTTINAYELLNNPIKTIPYLVEPLFPKTGLVALVGSSDCGKSTFLRQLAMSIVTKQADFLGYTINALHNNILYISTEDGYEAMSAIMKKQFSNQSANINTLQLQFCFDVEDAIEYLNNYFSVPENLLDCVIIDAFGDVFNGDSNMVSKVRPFLNQFKIISERNNCLIMFLHHTGKKTENSAPHKDNLLGSQGFEAKMRVVIEIRKDKTRNDIRHLCIVKGNYISDEFKSKSIELNFSNMVYTPTNNRVEFVKLIKPKNTINANKIIERDKEILILHKQNKSTREIETALKEKGHKISKSTVSNVINKQPKVEILTSKIPNDKD